MEVNIRRILMAEDSDRDAELTLTALDQKLVNKVVRVRDGAEALDYLYQRGSFAENTDGLPAVILLDLKMPQVGGLEVLRQLRSDPKLNSVPVVVMTSSREEQDLVTSYELGVNAYVVKPVDFADFVKAVKQVGVFWAIVNEIPSRQSC